MQINKNLIWIFGWGTGHMTGRCLRALLFMSMVKVSSKVIYSIEFPLPLVLPKAAVSL